MNEGLPLLEAEIRRLIATAGPMPVSEYMRLCLTHPQHGYYITRDPFGSGGDFTTAPEISQIFGELIGLWAVAVWRLMGAPENVRVVELGPGRGTLMRDALRAAAVVPEFHQALVVHMVEVSPALQTRQRAMLERTGVPVLWHSTFEEVPPGPLIVIANEFFDALPVNQAVKQSDGWHERVVTVDQVDNLAFAIGADPNPLFDKTVPRRLLRDAVDGDIFEWRSDRPVLELARRIAHQTGAALIIDYGHESSALGDTLQAVGSHAFADPLSSPGMIDLTAHVDFEALAQAAESIGTVGYGPVDQGALLRRLGLDMRAVALKRKATQSQRQAIDAAVARLTAGGREGMGRLFKALGLAHPSLGKLPGFEP
jgi:SAM-dependent MidA family methyltransferase